MSTLITEIISTSEKRLKTLAQNQKQVLVKRLEGKPYLEPGEKYQLAESLNMSVERISSWFRNSRFRRRKKELLCKYKSNLQ